jgi:hypothetical protein
LGRLSEIEMTREIFNKDEIRHQPLIVSVCSEHFTSTSRLHFSSAKTPTVISHDRIRNFWTINRRVLPNIPPSERLLKIFRDTINPPANAIQRTIDMDSDWSAPFDGLRRRSESPTLCITRMISRSKDKTIPSFDS